MARCPDMDADMDASTYLLAQNPAELRLKVSATLTRKQNTMLVSAKDDRGRRVIRRSKFGCRNCKLRKIKCDERRPLCKRCCSFGLVCNYLHAVADLLPAADDSIRSAVIRGSGPQPPISSAVWTSDATASYQLSTKCQDFITRYLARGLINRDDPILTEVNRNLLELTFIHPYLMHASLAVAFAYDRYQSGSLGSRRTPEECYHWYKSTVLFNRRLKQPIEAKDKDPLWGTAAALAILSFAFPDACTVEESWPLQPLDPSSDLEWVRMGKGKMSLWKIVNPMRPDSLFRIIAPSFAQMHLASPTQGISGIPKALAEICRLGEESTAESNAYFSAAHAVAHVQSVPDGQITPGHTQILTRCIQGRFKDLLYERDPVALLLMYLWYGKAQNLWWVALRARVERPAIRLYLQMYHKHSAVCMFLPGGVLAECWS